MAAASADGVVLSSALTGYNLPLLLKPLQPQLWQDIGDPSSVAVVIPSYNHAKFIERTLRSIFAQTLQPICLLLIDDGSTDGSPEIIGRVLQDSQFLAQLIARENRGLSATLNEAMSRIFGRNAGVSPANAMPTAWQPDTLRAPNSRGPALAAFFAYLGSDDVWFPNFLEKRVALLNSRPTAVLAYGDAYSIDAEDRIIDCSVDWAHYTDGDVRQMLLEGTAPLSPSVVYRREALDEMSWNENSRLEDYEFYLRLSAKGEFAYDPEILSAWRQHGANTSEGSLMMMEEKIAALHRTAGLFGLSPTDLDSLVRLAHFRGAQELMRRGHKSLATKHGLPNLTAARSIREAVRFLAGLATPTSVLASRREKSRKRASRHYARLDLGKDESTDVRS